ncbi:MAG: CcoQ/FixQ family Cbb3-type cytochrome c oxidase assembly chaperone [Chitinophagaceae bacterium]|nr:CcoQ/FixQ family Cbb3-type cytochrome c oxidase assembly chaperone [Chitinophagaceae bacterium]
MKFIHYLESTSGVGILGLISFGIFFLFFIAMLTWVFRTDKRKIDEISRIPLDKEDL